MNLRGGKACLFYTFGVGPALAQRTHFTSSGAVVSSAASLRQNRAAGRLELTSLRVGHAQADGGDGGVGDVAVKLQKPGVLRPCRCHHRD